MNCPNYLTYCWLHSMRYCDYFHTKVAHFPLQNVHSRCGQSLYFITIDDGMGDASISIFGNIIMQFTENLLNATSSRFSVNCVIIFPTILCWATQLLHIQLLCRLATDKKFQNQYCPHAIFFPHNLFKYYILYDWLWLYGTRNFHGIESNFSSIHHLSYKYKLCGEQKSKILSNNHDNIQSTKISIFFFSSFFCVQIS